MKTKLMGSLVLAIMVLIGGISEAEVLGRISVRGILTDSERAPLDGMMDVTFTLYSSRTGDTPLWAETYTDMEIVDGCYSVHLGTNTFLDVYSLANHAEIWLGITVDKEKERNRILIDSVVISTELTALRNNSRSRGSILATSDGYNYTLPAAASVEAGKILCVKATNDTINLYPSGSDSVWTGNGYEVSSASAPAEIRGGSFVSDGVGAWRYVSGS